MVGKKRHSSIEEETMINYQSQTLHTKISTFFKFMVFRIISQIKRDRTQVPRNTAGVGNILFCFEIPEKISNKIDMDKLPHLEIATNLSERQLSFKERLEGWNIERHQRETGRTDVYYRHRQSKRVLRSIYEIVIFLMYESSPAGRKTLSSRGEDGEEYRIWENINENDVEAYKKLEDEAAEALISMCDDDDDDDKIVNNNENEPPPTVVKVASTSSSSPVAPPPTPPTTAGDDDAIDLINHIPICKTMEEVQEFLLSNRKTMDV